MSRVGKKPIEIPSGLEVVIQGSRIVFKSGKIQKELETYGRVGVDYREKELVFSSIDDQPQSRAYWGTYRALASNIVVGLTKGFSKVLEVNGVGYRSSVSGSVLELILGFSHPVKYSIPDGIEIGVDKNLITIKGDDKQKVGQVAAEIRAFRPPEPYKGKGIKYIHESILRKAGKTAKK